jgi:hypothetical protein
MRVNRIIQNHSIDSSDAAGYSFIFGYYFTNNSNSNSNSNLAGASRRMLVSQVAFTVKKAQGVRDPVPRWMEPLRKFGEAWGLPRLGVVGADPTEHPFVECVKQHMWRDTYDLSKVVDPVLVSRGAELAGGSDFAPASTGASQLYPKNFIVLWTDLVLRICLSV